MITVLINAIVKENKLLEFKELASTLTTEARKRKGCILYSFNQRLDNPTEFVIYEQWENQSALDEHIQALIELLGPPKEGELLPVKLLDMYEEAEANYYETIE